MFIAIVSAGQGVVLRGRHLFGAKLSYMLTSLGVLRFSVSELIVVTCRH